MVAPAYQDDNYVNIEVSANLDSTFAFEGPEKLLEIWFWKSENDLPENASPEGLRAVPLEKWVQVLDLVSCKILSMKSSKFMDSYLLSESSLFVFPHKMILKTCGTTTTLACIEKVFEIVNESVVAISKATAGLANSASRFNSSFSSKTIYKMFYSRRSFMFPDKQLHVHSDWKNEVALLNKHFLNGKSYVVGDYNSEDHWFLFMGGSETPTSPLNGLSDQTFEILMTELDQEKAHKFVTSRKPGVESLLKNGMDESDLGHVIGIETMIETSLNSIFDPVGDKKELGYLPSPSMSDNLDYESDEKTEFKFIHDAFSFSPCGFSSNSVCSNQGGFYYTFHITPEAGWSYALFETNYPFNLQDAQVNIIDVLLRVLKIFEPRKFSMTLINDANLNLINAPDIISLQNCDRVLKKHFGYAKQERVLYDLKDEYKLLYLNFEKK